MLRFYQEELLTLEEDLWIYRKANAPDQSWPE
jgi:hypothetical protein